MSRLPQLEGQLVGAAARRSRQRRPPLAWRTPRLGRPGGLLSVGGVAAIAAIVAVALLSGGTRSADSAAAAALRTVAVVARSKPVAPVPGRGQFVYVRSRAVNLLAYSTHGPFHLRGDVFAYGAVLTTVREQWTGAKAGRQRFHESGPVLVSARDRRAWIAAGRPALRERRRPNAGALGRIDRALPLDLPTNPAVLLARLERTYASHRARVYAFVFGAIADDLRDPNASAAQRAALFEAAARLPGVRLLGERTDSAGRKGLGFAMVTPEDSVRLTLIVDPRTALLLEQIEETLPGNAIPAGTVTSRQTFGAPRIVAAIGSRRTVPARRP